MRKIHKTLVLLTFLGTVSSAIASADPTTVTISAKKHSTKVAALEVTACMPATGNDCEYDPTTVYALLNGRQFGVSVLGETASPTLYDAYSTIKRVPNITLRGPVKTANVIVVWDRRL